MAGFAKWREDRVWYRCQVIIDKVADAEVDVLFTDYGNQDTVNRLTEFVLLPTLIPQGEQCCGSQTKGSFCCI
jgi:hypothetical protein